MSGGSFEYLYLAVDGDGLSSRKDDIARMRDRLRELGHEDVAIETGRVLEALTLADKLAGELSDVWRAAEWNCSGDWGDEKVADAICVWLARPRISRASRGGRRRRNRGR